MSLVRAMPELIKKVKKGNKKVTKKATKKGN